MNQEQARIAIGILLIITSVTAWIDFDLIGRSFYFLSPDGSITGYMLMLLRLMLLSAGSAGLFLVFYEAAFRFFEQVDHRLTALDQKTLLRNLLLVGFALRLIVFLLIPIHLWGDYGSYDDLARQWIDRGGYYNGEHPTGYWPPLYPFFLSRLYLVFGEHASVAAFTNIFLGLCISLLAYFIVKQIWPTRVARWTRSSFISSVCMRRSTASPLMPLSW